MHVVTLGATWCNTKEPTAPRLWMATDSRISDPGGRLIDEGIKLYELTVLCRMPGSSGFFDTPFYSTAVGMAGAGGSLVYQHVYGTLTPLLANLIGDGTAIPTVAAVARLAADVTTLYVRSLGQRRHDAHHVTIVIAGHDRDAEWPDAFKIVPFLDDEGIIAFRPETLSLRDGEVHFIGNHLDEARDLLSDIEARNEPGAPRERAALNVIRAFITDEDKPTIGGQVQIGYTTGFRFRRVASVVPEPGHAPRALRLLNSIDIDALPPVGPCRIGMDGIVSP